MTAAIRTGLTLLAAGAAVHLLPSVLTVPPLHRRVAPRLSGRSSRPHVALTFDDGPDPASTPQVLDALAALGVHATFFLLGEQAAAHPGTARAVVERGHEVAVHGWAHVPHLLRTPPAVYADLGRACRAVRDACDTVPRYWRPPNGVLTGTGLLAARRHGLQPVLWTADGQDWRAGADARSVLARLGTGIASGGTVLLHDSDITSAPGSWRATVAALPELVESCHARGWSVGPLREHWAAA